MELAEVFEGQWGVCSVYSGIALIIGLEYFRDSECHEFWIYDAAYSIN